MSPWPCRSPWSLPGGRTSPRAASRWRPPPRRSCPSRWPTRRPACPRAPNCNANGVPDDCETDTDGDGVIDACDGCPEDADKLAPGACGCGVPDDDTDGDGVPDCLDNCPTIANALQADCDSDGIGDACEIAGGAPDCNANGIPDDCETDTDGDGVIDACDGCPEDADKLAPGACGCGVPDSDGDGDGVADCVDNCPLVPNPDQADLDGDGLGDVCERWYVDLDATGANDGRSWTHAFVDLQSALTLAQAGEEIWVAEGTYRPTAGTSRSSSFQLRSGVRVYGGFEGLETALAQRDPLMHVTVLSGDLLGDDGPSFANRADNSQNVLTGVNLDALTRLDGFTIRGGNADTSYGGGLRVSSGGLTIAQCVLEDNEGRYAGGAWLGSGAPVLIDCAIQDNRATYYGGGLYSGGNLSVLRCAIERNVTSYHGGGLWASRSVQLEDCTVAANTATYYGGGIYAGQGLKLRSCTVADNSSVYYGGGIYASSSGSTIRLEGTTIARNTTTHYGGGVFLSGTIEVSACALVENQARYGGGACLVGSAVVADSSLQDNSASQRGGGLYFLAADGRVQRCTFLGNQAGYQGGGLATARPTSVEGCLFVENTASTDGGALAFQHSGLVESRLTGSTLFGNHAAGRGGGVHSYSSSTTTVSNSILWGNTAGSGNPQAYQVTMRFCTIQGGHAGVGNLSGDPLFVSPASGDLRLLPGSPCVDSGDNAAVPVDLLRDLDGHARLHDDPFTPDTGSGSAPLVDRGAFEFGSSSVCPADCDGNGICDADELAMGTQPDRNGNGIPDACDGASEEFDWDPLETLVLTPGASADPVLDPLVVATNVSGAADASIVAVTSDAIVPGAAGYTALGRALVIETSLADGEFFLQVSLPFTQADLGGFSWSQIDLTYYDPGSTTFVLAVAGNTAASPGHPGPVGDPFMVSSTVVPSLSPDLGDYGVYWNPTALRGFVWANVDHTTVYTAGVAFGTIVDCDGNAQDDFEDLLAGTGTDCDGDGVLDACGIASGLSPDCDGNGIPDLCDLADHPELDRWPDGGDGVLDACQDVHPIHILPSSRPPAPR